VRMVAVPRDTWETLFRAEGAKNPLPRMQMLDGFNAGWMDFEGGAVERRRGATTLDEAIRKLVRAAPSESNR
jgi:NAD(P)H dehydrogenase (quinone)